MASCHHYIDYWTAIRGCTSIWWSSINVDYSQYVMSTWLAQRKYHCKQSIHYHRYPLKGKENFRKMINSNKKSPQSLRENCSIQRTVHLGVPWIEGLRKQFKDQLPSSNCILWIDISVSYEYSVFGSSTTVCVCWCTDHYEATVHSRRVF